MKKLLLRIGIGMAGIICPGLLRAQVNEVNFNLNAINFSAAPRTAISPMSIRMWDNYVNGGPSTYGTVLEFYGRDSHQTGQLYFGGNDNSRIRYREAFYAQNSWSDWVTLLDSKNDVQSLGNLKIDGAGTSYVQGNVGIGTASPQTQLHINGITPYILLTSTNSTPAAAIRGLDQSWILGYNGASGTEDISIGTQDGTGSRTLTFAAGGTARVKILANGNALIGKTSQSNSTYKLDVAGKVRADEIVVNTTGADFVFGDGYKVRTLRELEGFIKTNKHLPDIPPAKTMQEEGVGVGELQTKLLQKIEELTLYVIELSKENKEQEEKNKELEFRIKELEIVRKKRK